MKKKLYKQSVSQPEMRFNNNKDLESQALPALLPDRHKSFQSVDSLSLLNMKLTIVFHALLMALLSHLAFGSAIARSSGLTAREDTNNTVSTPYGDVVSTFLPDGKHKLEFFSDGVLQVTALEREDGGKDRSFGIYPRETVKG